MSMGTKRRGSSFLAGVLILALLIFAILAIDFAYVFTYAGTQYDVTVKVANVERSEHLYVHTNVWIDQYISSGEGGREALKYELLGHHDLIPGRIYNIKFQNVVLFNIWKGMFFITGRVISIQEIK